MLERIDALQHIELWQPRSTEDLVANSSKSGVVLFLSSGIASPFELGLIRRLKSNSACVFCIVDRGDQRDLGSACQILLAGAAHVLDLHSASLLSELCMLVAQAAEKTLASQIEEESLGSIMAQVGFAGQSADVLSLFRSVRAVSLLTYLPVLITGETGTGKELIALAIHSLDVKRRDRRLVSINCAALPEELSDSELFGHQRGSFTGAERERIGLLRAADGGMLFLDEVGELSLTLQAKLLRVLQTSQLRSVGADREIGINVRVIAATNRCLEQMVREGSFREDLLHRLNVLSLHIRPLRERPADIEPLIHHFVKKHHSVWQTKPRPDIGPDFVHALQKSSLPGNARQLENLVCRALVDWEGNAPLSLKDLPPEIWQELSKQLTAASSHEPCPPVVSIGKPQLEASAMEYLQQHDWNLPQAVRYVESILVRGALTASGGNQSEAARLLGITPRSVYNKIHRRLQS